MILHMFLECSVGGNDRCGEGKHVHRDSWNEQVVTSSVIEEGNGAALKSGEWNLHKLQPLIANVSSIFSAKLILFLRI